MEIKHIIDILEASFKIRCTLFENNKGAEEVANVPKNRPRTKHIAVKYHHFRSAVQDVYILVKQVDTLEPLAGIFSKPLTRLPFEYLRMQIMGWTAILSRGNSSTE